MNRETSLYLDLVRVSAALVVFFGHISGQRLTGGLLWQFGPFMDDAVVIFFVLSGFVIAHVVSVREIDVQQYAIARAARMYSVALPALVVTFFLDMLGKFISPELYTISWGYVDDNVFWRYVSGVFFVNQLWNIQLSIGSILPYWSLGFEVWYYFLFGVIYFGGKKYRWPLFIVFSLIAGPRILFLFPIWLLGYLSYRLIVSHSFNKWLSVSMLFGSILAYVIYCFLFKPILSGLDLIPHFLGDNPLTRYTVSVIFVFHLIGFAGVATHFKLFLTKFENQIRWLAGATFSIYLFHLPIAQFLSAIVPWPPSSWLTRLVLMGGTLIAVFIMAEFTERRKKMWVAGIIAIHQNIRIRMNNS